MNTYWVSNDESAETFWANEWKEHGTWSVVLAPDLTNIGLTGVAACPRSSQAALRTTQLLRRSCRTSAQSLAYSNTSTSTGRLPPPA
jgi:hypothetical protein